MYYYKYNKVNFKFYELIQKSFFEKITSEFSKIQSVNKGV